MEKNVGTDEAHIRTAAGAVLVIIAMFIIENATLRILFATMAAVLAGTAFFRTCPLYYVMKKSTRESDADDLMEEGVAPAPDGSTEMQGDGAGTHDTLKKTVPEGGENSSEEATK